MERGREGAVLLLLQQLLPTTAAASTTTTTTLVLFYYFVGGSRPQQEKQHRQQSNSSFSAAAHNPHGAVNDAEGARCQPSAACGRMTLPALAESPRWHSPAKSAVGLVYIAFGVV